MMAKISVVVPVYNVEKYLERCIHSVLSQTFADYELILVDDGSTDHSREMCDEYAQKDSRIRVIHKENGGQSTARNVGMELAQGEYLYFLDSDDWLEKNALELLYTRAEAEHLDILLFAAQSDFEESSEAENSPYAHYYDRKPMENPVLTGAELAEYYAVNDEFRCSVPLQFFRRSFLTSLNIRFYNGIYHEDELFSALILPKAQRVAVCTDKLYHRFVRKNSTMTGHKTHRHFDGLFITFARLNAEAMITPEDGCGGTFLRKHARECLYAATKIYKSLPKSERLKAMQAQPQEYALLYWEMIYNNADNYLPKKIIFCVHGIWKYGWGFPFIRVMQLLHIIKK